MAALRNNLAATFSPPIGGSSLTMRMAVEALRVRKGEPLIGALVGIGGAGTPYVFSIQRGALPPGVSLALDGALSGVPTTVGHFSFLAKVQDSQPASNIATFAINVIPALEVVAGTPTPAENTAPYTYTFEISGATGAVTWAASGTLPSDLTLSSAGVLSGTPDDTAGTYAFTATATDAGSGDALEIHCALTLIEHGEVAFDDAGPVPDVGGSYLPPVYVGVPYSTKVSVSGGLVPFTFSDTNGQLTALGFSINPNTGEVTGTITDASLALGFDGPTILAEVIAVDALGVTQITAQAALVILMPATSTDVTLGSNSDFLIPTQKAVKTYVDANAGGSTHANVSSNATLSQIVNRYTATGVAGTTPASPGDFDEIEVSIESAAFTGCSLVANTGQTINGAGTFSFDILPCVMRFRYNLAATNWFPLYYRIGDI